MRETMGLDQTNPDELARTRPKAEFDAIARRFIRDLLGGELVNSRMNKPKIVEYARPLASIPGVTSTRIEAEALFSNGDSTSSKKSAKRKTTPKKPHKIRRVEYANEIASALKSYGNYKLESLYHSICDIELEHHTPLVCIGAWAFFETLSACAGRNDGTAFGNFFSNHRLANYGITGTSRTSVRTALDHIQNYGNTTKHDPVAATFNGDQLNNDIQTLKVVILKCLEEAAANA